MTSARRPPGASSTARRALAPADDSRRRVRRQQPARAVLAPFGDGLSASPLPTLLMLIGVFGVGILMSMTLFGVAFARLMSAAVAARLGRAAAAVMALASMGLEDTG